MKTSIQLLLDASLAGISGGAAKPQVVVFQGRGWANIKLLVGKQPD